MDHGAGEVDALKKGVRSCSRCSCLALRACLLHESWVGLVQESFYANAFGCRQANHRIGLERFAGKVIAHNDCGDFSLLWKWLFALI